MQNLNDIKRLLSERGLRPKKKHGQNFLHDGNHMQRIIEAAQLTADDVILEIGPGTGALTERLLDTGAHVISVEIDPDMESILSERCAPWDSRFSLIMGDALASKHTLNPAIFAALDGRPFKMVANLPYHVASPLMANLATDCPQMKLGVVLIQKEVADRLVANPGGKDYGPLGIIIQAMMETRKVCTLPPGCFYPPPSVDSAVISMQRRESPLVAQPREFSTFLHKIFHQRRKQIGSSLGREHNWPEGVNPAMRPEQLTLEQLIAVFNMLSTN